MSVLFDDFMTELSDSWSEVESKYAEMIKESKKRSKEKKSNADSFVVGYDKSENGESALVVLRPKDATKSADYDEVCSYKGDTADLIYTLLLGVKGAVE